MEGFVQIGLWGLLKIRFFDADKILKPPFRTYGIRNKKLLSNEERAILRRPLFLVLTSLISLSQAAQKILCGFLLFFWINGYSFARNYTE